jgi:ADP-ribose pyrophosphatase YjhB (NUDIX family)
MSARPPVTRRWARFGREDRHWFVHVPEGGFCLSAFVIVHDRRGRVLLGLPREHRSWPERGCVPLWRVRQFVAEGSWILPSSHFLMDESPDAAARRVARDWAGIARASPNLVVVTSELMPTGRNVRIGGARRRVPHWALCLTYELAATRVERTPPGWQELRFMSPKELAATTIGRGHADLLAVWRRSVTSRPARSPP